jgi:putative inorganic carbon (hco3(-)) transporter
MNVLPRQRPAFISHPSSLVRASATLYLLHILFQGKIALLELSAFWSIFFLGWALAKKQTHFSFHILYYPLIVYGIVSTVSALTSAHRIHAAGEAMLWFKMLIFPAAIVLYREVPRLRWWGIRAHAFFAFGIAIWGLVEFVFFDRRDIEHRINGPSSHVMTFSGLLLPVSLLLLFLWRHERKWWQLTAGAVGTATLLLTFTRSTWLGWTVAAAAVLLVSRPRVVLYATPVLMLFITLMPLPLFSRLISTFDIEQSSNFDRIRMIQAGVEMIRDHPLLGVGPANVKEAHALYRQHDAPRSRPAHLHNNVIQLWAERGILALVAYVLLLALFFRECARGWRGPRRAWAEGGAAVAISLTVAGLFEFNFGDTEVFYMLLNLFALVVVSLEGPPELAVRSSQLAAEEFAAGSSQLAA